ncbi:MAG: TIGR04076 family protein [Desulfurococcaceae archaeon]
MVREGRDRCPFYEMGDRIVVEKFYINPKRSGAVCMGAFAAISTLLSAFLHDVSAVELSIGSEEDVGYLQCPDPGFPHTRGGAL